jgi:sugar phosphate isomerase/epimerase
MFSVPLHDLTTMSPRHFHRRAVIRTGVFAATALLTSRSRAAAESRWISALGCAGTIERAEFLKAQGAGFITAGTKDLLMPDQPDAEFTARLAQAKASPLPVLACNGFIPAQGFACLGPEANHPAVLAWAETALSRLAKVGGKIMVMGSSKSRRLPDGWPLDRADAQYAELLAKLGPIAAKHGVTIAVEQLQPKECNFLNHLGRAAGLIRRAAHPNVRLLADLFHMAQVGDSPDELRKALDVLVHVEIAEKEKRSYPGVMGDDFRPFLRVLREGGYRGAINIEASGTDDQIANAFTELARQVGEVP